MKCEQHGWPTDAFLLAFFKSNSYLMLISNISGVFLSFIVLFDSIPKNDSGREENTEINVR